MVTYDAQLNIVRAEIDCAAGASSDTHMDFIAFPGQVRIVCGWEHDHLMMVECIDKSFYAIAFAGYHSEAGHPGKPRSHIMSGAAR